MELVRGTTLRDQLDGRSMLDPREVAHVGAEVADALAAAHRAGLVHRDIKPANILLCADDRVMVTDFGIAKIRDDTDHTQTGTMLGTVKYLAPEQVRSEPVDGRTDIYSLGVVLFECACARPPFSGDNPAATALARLHQRAPRPSQLRPTIPPGLESGDPALPASRIPPTGTRTPTTCAPPCSSPACCGSTTTSPSSRRRGRDRRPHPGLAGAGRRPWPPARRGRHRRPPACPRPRPAGRGLHGPRSRAAAAPRRVAATGAGHRPGGRRRWWSPSCWSITPRSATACSATPPSTTTSAPPTSSARPAAADAQRASTASTRRAAGPRERTTASSHWPSTATRRPAGRPSPTADRHFGNLKQGVGISLTLAAGQRAGPAGGDVAHPGLVGRRSTCPTPTRSPPPWRLGLSGGATDGHRRRTPPSTCTAAPAATCCCGSPIWATARRRCAPRSTSCTCGADPVAARTATATPS